MIIRVACAEEVALHPGDMLGHNISISTPLTNRFPTREVRTSLAGREHNQEGRLGMTAEKPLPWAM